MPTPTTSERFDPKKSINAGYLKKNRTPPNAGIGRKKGQKNVVTQSMREMVHDFVLNNIASAQALYDRVAVRDPAKALQILTNLADFVLPRLARTEMTVSGTPPITAAPINDPAEAASVYAAVLGNTKIDLNIITFAAPPQPGNVVAVQGQKPSKAPVREMAPTKAASSELIRTAGGPPEKVVSLYERLGK